MSGKEVPTHWAAHTAWHRVLLLVRLVGKAENIPEDLVLNQVVVIALPPLDSWQSKSGTGHLRQGRFSDINLKRNEQWTR